MSPVTCWVEQELEDVSFGVDRSLEVHMRRLRAKLTPEAVWHEPRFHSRRHPPPRLRCFFHRSALFCPAAAFVKDKTSRITLRRR